MNTILALDFDGVICDSAPENAATAWRCCRKLWPELFSGEVPQEQLERFCHVLRPYMETGYQSIPMTWLACAKHDVPRASTGFSEALPEVLAEVGQTKESLKALFGAERDTWLRTDTDGWLAHNSFYPGAADALNALRKSAKRVLILTTKECRFVARLLEREGVKDFPDEDIFGLERIRNKETTLAELLTESPDVAFVEDRLATLRRVEQVPALNAIRLAFAEWGYCTDEHRAEARADERIEILHAPADLKGLARN